MENDCKKALQTYFGFSGFLDAQEEIVESILAGEEMCVIMPTGAGKSLCYQLPALLKGGYSVVVSPLISLMKDQVDSLAERHIPAACVNSSIPFNEQRLIFDRCRAGEIKLLYVAPERFGAESFRRFIVERPPAMLVVDEAHCISQWGHDFRPHYLQIGEAAERFNIPQVCAFTATATPIVRADIVKQLRRPNMRTLVSGFKRPNLAFKVLNTPATGDKFRALHEILKTPEPTIIYASTRKAVDELAAEFGVLAYHAGMDDASRAETQDKFMTLPAPVLAATNAFGMGIDRPDVRRIVHYNIPGTLEAYYQEAGRAGRDGEAAECILFFSYSDRYIQEFLIDMNNPPENVVREVFSALKTLARHRGGSLDVRASEIAGLVTGAKSERQVAAALTVLEAAGVIERAHNPAGAGLLRFTEPVQKLKVAHQLQATQRSRFLYRAAEAYGNALADGVEAGLDELCQVAGLSVDQLKRVLAALNGDVLEWQPPFSGRTILLKDPQAALDIDFDLQREKREFELARLDDVVKYAQCRTCRQKFIVEYFGEDSAHWQCENCDNCTTSSPLVSRPPTEREALAIMVILEAAYNFDRRFGMGTVSQVLVGAKTANLTAKNLHRNRFFGMLKHWKQNRVLLMMKSLERNGLLRTDLSSGYPLLSITTPGCQYNGKTPVLLDFPPDPADGIPPAAARKAGKPPLEEDAPFDETSELYEILRQLRNELAAARGVPPFQIFSNETLKDLCRKLPLTTAEATGVRGVGPVKAATVLPRFLTAIREWQKSQKTTETP